MFQNITLEMSLKPFKKIDSAYIRSVIRQVFDQWRPLIKNRETISVMLWTGDGSEILDYGGDLDAAFEWAYFLGTANKELASAEDPLNLSLHTKKRLYMDHPPKMTYRILKEIISIIKEEGQNQFPHSQIRVGETFDIGPEFAISDFKYKRHPEICSGQKLDHCGFLNSYGILNGDNFHYAGFPEGIPDQTPFGTFLGRQSQIFLTDMGFDYLWLSNGVGFSANPWRSVGDIFDGEKFHPNKLPDIKKKVFNFWKLFRAECPDIPIETRGTNFSAGIDYATDAVGLYDIYHAGLNIFPPPNSPWAALNGNFGLELMGHMSRICELPGTDYMFRYYLHDPWWVNSPWYDRYNGQPHDIYLPMSIARIDEAGQVVPATVMNILSIDNSFGDMPDCCVNEPLPHILKAEKNAPDDVADFVWIYPLREYTTSEEETCLKQMMSSDWFICRAINHGLPLNTVVTCDNFIDHDKALYQKSVLLTPVPIAGSEFEKVILNYAEQGGKVLFYGPVDHASSDFMRMLGLTVHSGISGVVDIDLQYLPDTYKDGNYPTQMNIRELFCAGKLNTHCSTPGITAGGYALSAEYKNAAWFRAPVGGRDNRYYGHLTTDNDSPYVRGEVLLRKVLEKYGYYIRFIKPNRDCASPVLTLHRSNNAAILSVFSANTTVEAQLKFPLGAPVLLAYETELYNGFAHYRFPRAVHAECRVFVEQDSGVVSAMECPPVSYQFRRRILVSGLKNATVRFFGESYCAEHVHAVLNSTHDSWYEAEQFQWETLHSPEYGTYFEARNVTGQLAFEMPFPDKI